MFLLYFVVFCRNVFLDNFCKKVYYVKEVKIKSKENVMILKILLFISIFVLIKNLVIKILSLKLIKELNKTNKNQ